MKIPTVTFKNKKYPVKFKQTPNYSSTNMKKIGMVDHMTTSNSFSGSVSWLTNRKSGVSVLFVVGRNVGEIIQLGLPNQKLWHAGGIKKPSSRFLQIAKYAPSGGFTNPNLYLDGIEFSGGVDVDKSGKAERDEIELTDWQYACGIQLKRWHAQVCGYELKPETQIIHQDISSHKPDMQNVWDEFQYRLFSKEERETTKESECICLSKATTQEVFKELVKRLT